MPSSACHLPRTGLAPTASSSVRSSSRWSSPCLSSVSRTSPSGSGFDRAVARRLLRFGAPLAIGLGIESVLLFSDSFVVGHLLGTESLGFYLLAFNISSWVPGIIGTAVRYVSIPAFSRLAEEAPDQLLLGVQRSLPTMIALVAPIAAVMATLSPALIGVLYGARWEPAADALRFPGVRDVGPDVHGTGVRHPNGAWQDSSDDLAEPHLAHRPAARAVDRCKPRRPGRGGGGARGRRPRGRDSARGLDAAQIWGRHAPCGATAHPPGPRWDCRRTRNGRVVGVTGGLPGPVAGRRRDRWRRLSPARGSGARRAVARSNVWSYMAARRAARV
ncbi:oligosaccharide flippase family protein [Nocardioides sp. B-3]|uniref:oligosaccharide flippase family protein n=1 Tax=Nocardioides sp. B-3 TaxID=2895565 RepID=UPI003FA54B7E